MPRDRDTAGTAEDTAQAEDAEDKDENENGNGNGNEETT